MPMRISTKILLPIFLLLGTSTATSTPIGIAQQDFTVDFAGKTISFLLTFDRIPDLYTADPLGRRADSFQYYFSTDPLGKALGLNFGDPIFRGEEAIQTGPTTGQFPIRTLTAGPNGPPHGYPITSLVDFLLVGRTLLFTVPWADLSETDGFFSYRVGTYSYGATGGELLIRNVPEPSSLALAATGFLLLLGTVGWRRLGYEAAADDDSTRRILRRRAARAPF